MQWLIGLNSLRFLAIVLIVVYHLFRNFLPGGVIAVEIFFTISGFLIIGKLIREAMHGKIHYWRFLRDRLLRIFPALLASVVISLALAYLVHPDVVVGAPKNTLAALTFTTNFMELFSGGSYENVFLPNIFEHTWFLALEMQLYLLIPFIFLLTSRATKTRRGGVKAFGIILTCLALASLSLMILYGGVFGLHDRAYFAPDSHMFAFCLGGLYAVINYFAPRPPRTPKAVPALGILLSCATVCIFSFKVSYHDAITYRYILPFTALLTAIMIGCVIMLQPNVRSRKKPSNIIRVLDYLGGLSFGVYLFHWPLSILVPNLFSDASNPFFYASLVILASFLFTLLCDRYFRAVRHLKTYRWPSRIAYVAMPIALIAISTATLLQAPQQSSITMQLESIADTAEDTQEAINYLGLSEAVSQTKEIIDTQVAFAADAKILPPINRPQSASSANSAKVLAVGDSVMLGAKAALESTVPGIFVDAKESRGIDSLTGILAKYAAKGKLPDIIVIALVTNQRNITESLLTSIVNVGGWDKTYILVTAYAGPQQPRLTQNAALKNFANKFGNVYIADWWEISHNNWSLMYADHIHLNPEGRTTYANLIYNTIRSINR